MEAEIHNYDIPYADETSLQVLKEKDRLPTQKSFMWLFIGGPAMPERRPTVDEDDQRASFGATDEIETRVAVAFRKVLSYGEVGHKKLLFDRHFSQFWKTLKKLHIFCQGEPPPFLWSPHSASGMDDGGGAPRGYQRGMVMRKFPLIFLEPP